MTEFTRRLQGEEAVLVTLESVEGSTPREAGAWMGVFTDGAIGSIGGGHLELQALATARTMLREGPRELRQRQPLGPSLGQCCGGVAHLRFERVGAQDAPALAQRLRRPALPVALFGGGHVGRALALVLGTLPVELLWIDSRDEIFPGELAANVRCEHSAPVEAAVADLVAGSHVLVMSFSHAEDLDIVAACLQRQRDRADLPWVGLIGSRTKWATFRQRLAQRGFTEAELAGVTCPIGVPGLAGKEPGVIAVSVAAQLMQLRAQAGVANRAP